MPSFFTNFFGDIYVLLLSLPIIIFSLSFHEWAHAFAAMKMGDYTAKAHGRLTLNPLAHLDPFGLLSMIFFRFGWAKPVPVNPYNFKKLKKGYFIVSFAGPVSNIILAFGFAVLYLLYLLISPVSLLQSNSQVALIVRDIFFYGMSANIVLATFNLIPIPPLDGSKILESLLPYKYLVKVERIFQQGQIILYILLIVLSLSGALTGYYSFVRTAFFSLIDPIISAILNLKGLL